MANTVGYWQSQPEVTETVMVNDLRRLVLDTGQAVLVHSSLSGLGRVTGGAHTVIDALLAVVGSSGTIVFPTLTGTEVDGPEHPQWSISGSRPAGPVESRKLPGNGRGRGGACIQRTP